MNLKLKYPAIPAGLLGLFLIVAFTLVGCADMNDNPRGEGDSVNVSVTELQRQLGYTEDSSGTGELNAPVDSDATTAVRTLLIGAVVIRSRTIADGAYDSGTPITDIGDQLEQDITDSGNNIKLFSLPSNAGYVEINLPPPSSEKWQLLAAAMGNRFSQVSELSGTAGKANRESVAYIGFNGSFLKTGNEGQVMNLDGGEANLTIEMKRACLVDVTPKGCAQYDEDYNLVITSAVEITGVLVTINGVASSEPLPANSYFNDYPVIVRDDETGVSPATAKSILSSLPVSGASEIIVQTTHNSSTTQDYRTTYE